MHAVIATGGKQYLVQEGDVIKIEKLALDEGKKVKFEQVLALEKEGEYQFGKPILQDRYVEGVVLNHGKNKKVIVFKYRPKKKFQKKNGHRQSYTEVRVEKII